eukprot:2389966-Prymnesium_polylepis.1
MSCLVRARSTSARRAESMLWRRPVRTRAQRAPDASRASSGPHRERCLLCPHPGHLHRLIHRQTLPCLLTTDLGSFCRRLARLLEPVIGALQVRLVGLA